MPALPIRLAYICAALVVVVLLSTLLWLPMVQNMSLHDPFIFWFCFPFLVPKPPTAKQCQSLAKGTKSLLLWLSCALPCFFACVQSTELDLPAVPFVHFFFLSPGTLLTSSLLPEAFPQLLRTVLTCHWPCPVFLACYCP